MPIRHDFAENIMLAFFLAVYFDWHHNRSNFETKLVQLNADCRCNPHAQFTVRLVTPDAALAKPVQAYTKLRWKVMLAHRMCTHPTSPAYLQGFFRCEPSHRKVRHSDAIDEQIPLGVIERTHAAKGAGCPDGSLNQLCI